MVPFCLTASIPRWALLGTLFLLASGFLGAQEPEGEQVSEIPNRFFQTQDLGGYFWQVSENGALTSGDTQYLQSGLNWVIAGAPFAPTKAWVRSPDEFPENAGVFLEESRDSLLLRRDLWVDRKRGGVRTIDTISNRGGSAVSLEVVLRTTYPFAWQSLHGTDGELLSKDPVLSLGNEDFGMAVHFSAAEGRHDTFFVVCGEEENVRPRVSASSNRRELSFTYRIVVPAGGSQLLLHWISQKALPEISMAPEQFAPFFRRGELIDPGIASSQRAGVVNFSPSAIPGESSVPGDLGNLLSLNSFLQVSGLERRSQDIHWISSTSQISGRIIETRPLKIQSTLLGEVDLPLKDIATIRNDSGERVFFYLRNGEVRVGSVVDGSLGLTPEGGEASSEFDLSKPGVVLFGVDESDGTPPRGAALFLQLIDQSVFAVNSEADSSLRLATPWGQREFAFDTISEVSYVSAPFPAYRVLTESGSEFSAFLYGSEMKFTTYKGLELDLPLHLLDRIWKTGARKHSLQETSTPWLSVTEVPGGAAGGVVLKGNAFLQGKLSASKLELSDNDALLPIETSMIQSITRDFESDLSSRGRVLVEMDNGETVTGEVKSPFLQLFWEGEELKIPWENIIAYQAPQS